MNLRYTLFAVFVAVGIMILKADDSDSTAVIINDIESSGKIDVIMPNGLSQRLIQVIVDEPMDTISEQDDEKTRVGYRVQVYDNNNVNRAKSGADAYKKKIENRFPELTAYVQFHSPYWRVKVGDFTTRSEAEVFMETIREEFPETSSQLRVVRDRINLQK